MSYIQIGFPEVCQYVSRDSSATSAHLTFYLILCAEAQTMGEGISSQSVLSVPLFGSVVVGGGYRRPISPSTVSGTISVDWEPFSRRVLTAWTTRAAWRLESVSWDSTLSKLIEPAVTPPCPSNVQSRAFHSSQIVAELPSCDTTRRVLPTLRSES
jgi:hypothetical protein